MAFLEFYFFLFYITLDRQQSKTLLLSTNTDQTSLETEVFFIAICRQLGDKWQSKTLFLAFFNQCLSIVKSAFECRLYPVCKYHVLSNRHTYSYKSTVCTKFQSIQSLLFKKEDIPHLILKQFRFTDKITGA